MGRRKSNYICPKCEKRGYIAPSAKKYGVYQRVIHYNHKTGRQTSCYIDKILEKTKIDNLRNMPHFKIHEDQNLPLGELASRTYMYYKDISMDVYRLSKRIESNQITDLFIIEIIDLLGKYLRLYIKRHLTFNSYKLDALELLEYKILEKKVMVTLRKLPSTLGKEYKVLLKKESLIDSSGRYRSISNYRMRERLRGRMKSIAFEISLVEKHSFFSDIFRFRFLIDLVTEYIFIKYDLPKKLINRKNVSLRLSKGHFGSEKYPSQYANLSQIT